MVLHGAENCHAVCLQNVRFIETTCDLSGRTWEVSERSIKRYWEMFQGFLGSARGLRGAVIGVGKTQPGQDFYFQGFHFLCIGFTGFVVVALGVQGAVHQQMGVVRL